MPLKKSAHITGIDLSRWVNLYTSEKHKYNRAHMNPQQPYQPPQPQQPQQPPQPQQPFSSSQQGFQQPSQPFGPAPMNPSTPNTPAGVPGVPMGAPTGPPRPVVSASSSKKWTIVAIIFIVIAVLLGGLAGWATMNYLEQKNNVTSKVDGAVALAKKEQKEADQAAFEKAEKEPNRLFAGPEDYGQLSFSYPKTWSAYEASTASGDTYEVFFTPGVIPSVENEKERFALRLTIEETGYDEKVDEYKDLITEGKLKSSPVTINGQNGVRLEGLFTEDIRGTAVIFKLRDKTVTLRTDADTFAADFNALIQTITFNK